MYRVLRGLPLRARVHPPPADDQHHQNDRGDRHHDQDDDEQPKARAAPATR
jgi:hypothetical protein